MTQTEKLVLDAVRRLTADCHAVHSGDVAAVVYYSPRWVRELMVRLAEAGELVRIGQRGGYRLA